MLVATADNANTALYTPHCDNKPHLKWPLSLLFFRGATFELNVNFRQKYPPPLSQIRDYWEIAVAYLHLRCFLGKFAALKLGIHVLKTFLFGFKLKPSWAARRDGTRSLFGQLLSQLFGFSQRQPWRSSGATKASQFIASWTRWISTPKYFVVIWW